MGGSNSKASGDADWGVRLGEFDAKYLGSVPVKSPTGNDVCTDAVTRVKHLKHAPKKTNIIITPKGIFVVDIKTGDTVKEAPIKEVSFVSMDAQDKKLFSYITNQVSLGLMFCHTFSVKARAQEIPVAINQAFQISAGKMQAPKGKGKKMSKKEALKQANMQRGDSKSKLKTGAMEIFEAKYLGSVAVSKPKGNEVVLEAARRIKQLNQAARIVEIVVHPTAIEVVNKKTQDVIKEVPIMEVSFTAIHPQDKKMFLYISNDARLDLIYCHAFSTKNASAIPGKIQEAFKIAHDKLPEDQKKKYANGGADADLTSKTGATLGVFESKFIGSAPVKSAKGAEVAEQAVKDVYEIGMAPEGCVILISSEGIRMVEGLTGEVLKTIFIASISFCSVVGKNKDLFCFIHNDERLDRKTCFVFESGARAYEICTKIGEAFKVAHAEHTARAGNPFAAIDGEREASSTKLFKKQVHRTQLTAGKAIGAGQFGEVFLAQWKPKDAAETKVAVKMLRGGASDGDKSEFIREAETMVDLEHPNLVAMLGVAVQQYGDLRDVLQACKEKQIELNVREQVVMAKQVCAGMGYIASLGYIHMDLAARNCLLHENNNVKVADFGLTRALDFGKDHHILQKSQKLPIKWMAIESLDEKMFSEESDVWSFGVLLWEISSYGALPYGKVKNVEIQSQVRDGLRLTKVEGSSQEFYDIAYKCWNKNRKDRPKFAALQTDLDALYETSKGSCKTERDVGAAVTSK